MSSRQDESHGEDVVQTVPTPMVTISIVDIEMTGGDKADVGGFLTYDNRVRSKFLKNGVTKTFK